MIFYCDLKKLGVMETAGKVKDFSFKYVVFVQP